MALIGETSVKTIIIVAAVASGASALVTSLVVKSPDCPAPMSAEMKEYLKPSGNRPVLGDGQDF